MLWKYIFAFLLKIKAIMDAEYEMHVPTPFSVLAGSRRPSSSSMRSGLSFRTQSSFRGYRYYSRDPVRRTLSSPAESSPQYAPTSPCKVPHHNHPLHHNSPVDDEDIMDVSKYIFCSSSIWRTKYISLNRYNKVHAWVVQ